MKVRRVKTLDEKIQQVKDILYDIAENEFGVECIGPRKYNAILELGEQLESYCE